MFYVVLYITNQGQKIEMTCKDGQDCFRSGRCAGTSAGLSAFPFTSTFGTVKSSLGRVICGTVSWVEDRLAETSNDGRKTTWQSEDRRPRPDADFSVEVMTSDLGSSGDSDAPTGGASSSGISPEFKFSEVCLTQTVDSRRPDASASACSGSRAAPVRPEGSPAWPGVMAFRRSVAAFVAAHMIDMCSSLLRTKAISLRQRFNRRSSLFLRM